MLVLLALFQASAQPPVTVDPFAKTATELEDGLAKIRPVENELITCTWNKAQSWIRQPESASDLLDAALTACDAQRERLEAETYKLYQRTGVGAASAGAAKKAVDGISAGIKRLLTPALMDRRSR